MEQIDNIFLRRASDILGDTTKGLSTTKILNLFNAFAFDYNVQIPHTHIPLTVPNKRTALYENISMFDGVQQFKILQTLCEQTELKDINNVQYLKSTLFARYPQFSGLLSQLDTEIINTTKHWLDDFPEVQSLYEQAMAKYEGKVFQRNLLDDLRLSLEILLKSIFQNDKSIENQKENIGNLVQAKGGSKEYINMFVKLIDYYAKYQNIYVKHDDNVNTEEIEFIIELTSCLMRQLVRLTT